MDCYLKEYFENWIPAKPTLMKQTKNFIELSFEQPSELFRSFNDALLYKVQTNTKVLGWVNVYCGGKISKIFDNLQPGRPHKFRLKIILKYAKMRYLDNYELEKIKSLIHNEENCAKLNCNHGYMKMTDELMNGNVNEETGQSQEHEKEKVNQINDQFLNKSVDSEQNYKGIHNFISKGINPKIHSGETLNNDKRIELIESLWSEELTACTDTEGPTVFCFCMAVRCGYIKQVQAMLEERPNLIDICNTTDGFTPLATAVRKGNIQMVKYLLGEGADVNQRSSTSQTPLHLAVYSANVTLSELLLERGADIGFRDRNGLTVLHYAVDSGDLAILQFALKIADVNDRDNKGWTGLHRAVMQGASAAVVQELLAHGADGELPDARGLSGARLSAAPALRARDDLRRLVDKTFVHDTALTNFTKLTKKLSTIHTLAHK